MNSIGKRGENPPFIRQIGIITKKQNKRGLTKMGFEKLQELGILSKEDFEKLQNGYLESWIYNYIQLHQYFSPKKMTGDFMLQEFGINLRGHHGEKFIDELRRILVYRFLPYIKKLKNLNKIQKINSYTYEVKA